MRIPPYTLPFAALMLVTAAQASAECSNFLSQVESSLTPDAINDSPREAYQRADACLATKAWRFAKSTDEATFVADAVQGACSEEVSHAAARSQMAAVAAGVTSPPPDGFFIDLPACKSGADECPPWEREWTDESEPLANGTLVGSERAEDVQAAGIAVANQIRLRLEERSKFWVLEARICSSEISGG